MDLAAIKSRLADSNGRLYWRSLGELADTPDFREYLHREFPEQASEWNDPKGRRNFLKLMSASLALAGVGACTKQPPETLVPYVRLHQGQAELALGNDDAAAASAAAVLKTEPKGYLREQALWLAADVAEERGQWKEAAEALSALTKEQLVPADLAQAPGAGEDE